MQNKIILFILVPIFAFAAYNPFFTGNQPAPRAVSVAPTVVSEPLESDRRNIQMAYFGFVETNKGAFALVSFNGKNIVVREADPVYLNAEIFTVKKISSNYLLITDGKDRVQTVYFSSSSGK